MSAEPTTAPNPSEPPYTISDKELNTTGAIDAKLIVPFVQSVRDVFKTMVHAEVKVQRPTVKDNTKASFDVSSVVQFGGDVSGSVVLSFESDAAIKLVESFAGFAFDLDDTDFADAIGELGNMVAGAAKKNLNCEASIGIPTVVIGANHRIARLTEVPCIVVPCNTDVGNFAVEISIRSTQVAKAAA